MTKLQVFPHQHRKTFTWSLFQNTLEDLNIPQIKIDASRKPKVVFYSLCQQLRSITDFRESLFSQCLAVRARQANEMLAKGYKQSSRFGRWDPVEVFVILFPFSVAVQCIVSPILLSFTYRYTGAIYSTRLSTESKQIKHHFSWKKAVRYNPIKHQADSHIQWYSELTLISCRPWKTGRSSWTIPCIIWNFLPLHP